MKRTTSKMSHNSSVILVVRPLWGRSHVDTLPPQVQTCGYASCDPFGVVLQGILCQFLYHQSIALASQKHHSCHTKAGNETFVASPPFFQGQRNLHEKNVSCYVIPDFFGMLFVFIPKKNYLCKINNNNCHQKKGKENERL